MGIFQKIKEWWDQESIEGVMEYKKYGLTVTLVNGEVLELESNKYHAISCSYSKYITIGEDHGLRLRGKFYPWHMIKHIEDEVIDKQLICSNTLLYGFGGLTKEEIDINQEKYSKIIEKYKSMNNNQEVN